MDRTPRLHGALPWALALVALAACGKKIDPVAALDVPAGPVDWCADVRPVMEARCTSCHAAGVQGAARGGAPTAVDLDTFADVSRWADRVLSRMQARSMPPGGGVPDGEVATVAGWIASGKAECGPVSGDVPEGGDRDLPGPADADGTAPADPGPLEVAPGGPYWCDQVAPMLATHCTSCHASNRTGTDRGGATPGVDYDTYEAAAQAAVAGNLYVKTGLMPPNYQPAMPAADKALFQAWVDAGTPACGQADGVPVDLPVIDVPLTDPGPPVPTCTSGQHWTLGEDTTDALRLQMHPGRNCNECHATRPGGEAPPIFVTAGTVMGALHDEDECYGVSGVTVEITGSDKVVTRLTTNGTGNFLLESGAIATPYTVVLRYQGRERAMLAEQNDRNCMNCHTMEGVKPCPGRILAP